MRMHDCVLLNVDDTLADFAYEAARLLSIQTRVTKFPENWRTHNLANLYNTTPDEVVRILREARAMYESLRLTDPEWVNFSDYCYSISLPIVVVTARSHIFGQADATLLTHKWLGRNNIVVKEVHAVRYGESKAEYLYARNWNPVVVIEDNQEVLLDFRTKFPESKGLLYTRPTNEDFLPKKLMTRIHSPRDAVTQLQLAIRSLVATLDTQQT